LIVLDASAVVEFLLGSDLGARVRQRISGDDTLHAPHLLDVEVANAMRRWVLQGRISEPRGRALLDDLLGVPLTRYPHEILLSRMWDLRANASAYDAAYIVLGEILSAPVVTCDARVAGIPGHGAAIEVI
jgi:predicted nucleic acid-binding protein